MKHNTIPSWQVANFFIKKAKDENVSLTNLKLNKLVYIAYGWVSAIYETKLFDDEINAWQYGPVIPDIYLEFKEYGRDQITGYGIGIENQIKQAFSNDDNENNKYKNIKLHFDENVYEDYGKVLNKVWEVYKEFSGSGLIKITHEKDTPWYDHYENGKKNVIEFDSIKKHFKSLISSYLENIEQTKNEKKS